MFKTMRITVLVGVGGVSALHRYAARLETMDSLRRDDIDRARRASHAERAAQAFEAMRVGIRLRRAALRARHPEASETEVEGYLRSWLARDG